MDFQIILMTIIAFSAVISVLSFAFSLLLSPVKENQARMEKEITVIRNNQAKMEKEITAVKSDISILKEDVSAIKQAVLKNTA